MIESPLPVASLSALTEIPKKSLDLRLNLLHSVLDVPTDATNPTPLWINEKEIHEFLTTQCLKLMRPSLNRNICNSPGEGTLRSEIDKGSVDFHLSHEMQYACRYWTQHLVKSQDLASALTVAFLFLKAHFLHWVETMNVLGLISKAIKTTKRLKSAAQNIRQPEILYSSGLMFCPSNSVTRQTFKSELLAWYQVPKGHYDWVCTVCFSPDGQLLASGSDDHTIKFWDPSTGELRQTLRGHSGSVCSVTFSPDGQLLASGSDDQTIKLWNPSTAELRQTLKGHMRTVYFLSFSPKCRFLASGSYDDTIKLWNLRTGELHQTFQEQKGWACGYVLEVKGFCGFYTVQTHMPSIQGKCSWSWSCKWTGFLHQI
ncbi:WD40-repeat-containing domain protein [Aspergillus tetrazonus]